jgi:hypothetical protein
MKTYNRLKQTIKNSFSFSDTEVEAAFRIYLESKSDFSSEAVNSFGGFKQLVKAAVYQHKRKLRRRLEARKTLTLDIEQDTDENNDPRDFDNLGTMVCFHRSYNLGDKHDFSVEDIKALVKRKDVLALPLFLIDHSGLSMSVRDFGCPWDSGQVGFIFIDFEKIRKEFSVKKVTKKLLEQVKKSLIAEVDTYDSYLRGEVYGYLIKDADGEVLDSCWGFIGYDHVKSEGEAALKALSK